METQTQVAPTTTSVVPVSFENITLDHLGFNETYRVTRGSASQVVLGLRHMLTKLATPTNDYQRTLYPRLSELTRQVVDRYVSTFLGVSEPVVRQVYGANLNGPRNDGSLYHSVNSGVNRSLTYGYAQFGQLMKVLTNRLRFVTNRRVESVERYRSSQEEGSAYRSLQERCTEYLTYLSTVNEEWIRVVESVRTQHNVTPQRPSGQNGQSESSRPQRSTRQKRFQGSGSQGGQSRRYNGERRYGDRSNGRQPRTDSEGFTEVRYRSGRTVRHHRPTQEQVKEAQF
jgi:hypothetical protein